MTGPAPGIVLAAMALEAGSRIDFAVNGMLRHIVPWMGHGPLRRIFIFVTWFELFFMRMAVRAEGLRMAHVAGPALLE
jgi:hypothetical protein